MGNLGGSVDRVWKSVREACEERGVRVNGGEGRVEVGQKSWWIKEERKKNRQ